MEMEENEEADAKIEEALDGSPLHSQPVSLHLNYNDSSLPSGVSTAPSSTVDNSTRKTCTLLMVLPSTEPPRQQTIIQTLPSIIHFPKLPFIDPAQLKPIDLSVPLPTRVKLHPEIANKLQEMNAARVMSHMPEPSRSRVVRATIIPASYCRNQLRLARKQVLIKIGVPCWSEEKKLLAAVRNADESTVGHLLQKCVDPNTSDIKKRTPLHIAASQGLANIVSHLVIARADPNRQDILGNTPLHLAVCRGDARTVNILLRSGANINQRDNVGRTPLTIVKSRLGTLRRDKSISTDKLISECQMINDILKVHCNRQSAIGSATKDDLCSSTVDVLCNMVQNISTREQADEVADTMIEKMSQLHIENTSRAKGDQKQEYHLSIL